MHGHNNDHYAESRILTFRSRLRAIVADESLEMLAARAGLTVSELADVVDGRTVPDLYLAARLEGALGVPLWPRYGVQPNGGATADG